jgi:hypothetical protein
LKGQRIPFQKVVLRANTWRDIARAAGKER